MTEPLQSKKCTPCKGGQAPLDRSQAKEMLKEIPQWQLSDDAKEISHNYIMKNFTAAVDLINKIKNLAEQEDHHPDIHLTGYRNLKIDLSTHKIGGLSENDFILAAKINQLPAELKTA